MKLSLSTKRCTFLLCFQLFDVLLRFSLLLLNKLNLLAIIFNLVFIFLGHGFKELTEQLQKEQLDLDEFLKDRESSKRKEALQDQLEKDQDAINDKYDNLTNDHPLASSQDL